MIKNFLLALALLPSLALGASNIRTEKQETLFEKGIAFTQRSESSGSTLNAMATNTTYVKLSSVVETINGMAAPADGAPKIVIVSNMTGAPVTFVHEEAAATAENRFDLPKGKDLKIQDRASATFIYDHGADRWVSAGGSSSGSGTGAVNEVAQSSHGFSVGDVLYYDGSGYALAQADDLASAEVLGVVSEIQDADNFLLTTVGYIEGLSGLIPGGTYYLSDSVAGQLTATEPTTVDHVSKPVLVAVSTTSGYVIHSRGAIIMEAAPDMPMVNKGELYGFDGTDPVATPVCANDEVLIADSSTPSGWVCGESMPDVVPISNGGTGQTAKAEAFDALATKKNWLTNESFEHATATTGWTVSGTWTNETTAENVVHGVRGIKMPSGAASISQSVSAPNFLVGQNIQQTIWVKTTDPAVQVCSLRAGSSFECTYAPSDGFWHQVGFTYKDPGTGSRGISVSRASGTADVYVDMAYVGAYEPNVPAQINVGDTFFGSTIWPDNGSCTFTASATGAYVDMSPSSCSGTPISKGQFGVPSSFAMGVPIAKLPKGRYRVYVNGVLSASTNVQVTYRITDGTNSTDALLFTENVAYRAGPSWADLEVPSDLYGVTLKLQAKASSGTPTIYNYSGNPVRISMDRLYDYDSLAGSIITDEPWYYISSKLTTRVTSTPDAEGEYRSYAKNGSAYTYADAAPSIAPSGTNGMNIQGRAYSSGGGSDGNTRYEIFIGRDKTFSIEAYSSTGRTGQLDHKHFFASTSSEIGLSTSYDPSTGVLTVDAGATDSSVSNRYIGNILTPGGAALTQPGSGYFDIKVFNNPLAAGLKTATDFIWLYGTDGMGSTANKIPRMATLVQQKGDGVTHVNSAANGSSFTVNKEGMWTMCSNFGYNGAAIHSGISLNSTNLTTGIASLNPPESIGYTNVENNSTYQFCRTMPLSKGDVIRPHTNGTSNYSSTDARVMFTMSRAPSPFEIMGASGYKPGYSYHGKAFNSPGSVNLSTSFSGEGTSAASWTLTSVTQNSFTCAQYTSGGSAYAGITCTPPRSGTVEVTAQFPHIDGSSAVDQVQIFNGTIEIGNLRSYGGGQVFPMNIMGHDTVTAGVPMSWRLRGSGGSTPQIYNGIVYWSVKYID